MLKYKPDIKYDIIISNPPYLTKKDDTDIGIKYEPKKALFAKEKGNYFYKEILKKYQPYLKEKYIIAFETGTHTKVELEEFAKKIYPNANIIFERDLSDKYRYMIIINE